MKNNSGQCWVSVLIFFALQFPLMGYCDSGSGWIKSLFESKGKNMKEVAVKVAELHEDEDINIWGLDFSPDGKYLAATSPNTVSMSSNRVEVQIWDWQSGKIVRTLEKAGGNDGHTTESIRYSPDGRLLVACHSRAQGYVVARIWNTETWAIVHDITDPVGGGQGCSAIGFTPDGKSLIRITDRIYNKPGDNLFIYDTATWQPMWGLRTVPFQPEVLTISPDGNFIALGGSIISSKPQVVILDMTQRAIVRTIENFDVERLAWSPDGIHIAAVGAEYTGAGAIRSWAKIFEAQTGKQVNDETLESGRMFIRYTPDGKYLIEGGMDGLHARLGIRIWDGQHKELLQEMKANVGSLAVSRDGHYLAVGSRGKIFVWKLN